MNQKLRLASVLLMLPLFTIALTTHSYQEADAAKAQGSTGHIDPQSFGSKNAAKICGDELCSVKTKSAMSDKMMSDKKMSDKMMSDKKMSDKMMSDKKMSDKKKTDKNMTPP